MKTKKAMQQCKLKYFSGLTSKQKDETINFLRILKNGLTNLNKDLALTILKNLDLEIVIKENEYFGKKLNGSKMFLHEKTWLPLNFKDVVS